MMTQSSYVEHDVHTLSGTYTIDPDSSRIGFEARHAVVTKVHGAFHDFAGTAVLDGDDPSRSRVELTIEVASLSTGHNKRDDHLRTNEFFDAARFPQIHFVSTQVRRVKPSLFELTGNLTIKGVTKAVTVPFEFNGVVADSWGNHCAGFEGRIELNRRDWGVNFSAALEAGGVLVSDKVTLSFDISAVKRLEAPGAHHIGRPIEETEMDLVVPVVPGVYTVTRA